MPDPVDAYGPRRRSILPILVGLIIALLLGMGAMAWLFHRFDSVAGIVKPQEPVTVPVKAPERPALVTLAAPPPPEIVETIVDKRIEKIEAQVEDIGERAAEATSEAQRAERLLIAFAARRAIDRGAPLGYLEAVLRQRFGRIEPQAVAMVISASRQPVTITQLRDGLDALRPQLASTPGENGWLEGIRRELAGLIVVRRADAPSTAPIDRYTRAHDALAAGQVDAALLEVTRLPGRQAATGWIAQARRYVQARAALDRIEGAALLDTVDEVRN